MASFANIRSSAVSTLKIDIPHEISDDGRLVFEKKEVQNTKKLRASDKANFNAEIVR